MEQGKSVIERALEIAAEGQCVTVTQIRFKLKSEGYLSVDSHLAGGGIREQLKSAMRRAKGAA